MTRSQKETLIYFNNQLIENMTSLTQKIERIEDFEYLKNLNTIISLLPNG